MSSHDEPTESITDISENELENSFDNLLGPVRPTRRENRLLVRLHSGVVSPELGARLGISSYKPALPSDRFAPPVVLGPFTDTELRALVSENLIAPNDYVLRSFDRWKTIKTVFPDMGGAFSTPEEITATATLTGTVKGFDESPDTGTPTDEFANAQNNEQPALEIEEIPPEDSLPRLVEDTPPPVQADSSQASRENLVPRPIVVSSDGKVPSVQHYRAVQSESRRKTTERATKAAVLVGPQASVTASSKPSPSSSKRGRWIALSAAVLLAAVATIAYTQGWFSKVSRSTKVPASAASAKANRQAPVPTTAPKVFPENLRPLPSESLYASDPAMVQKIRPVLNAYERGGTVLSEVDEQLLRAYADPASASWEARRLASNQLAVYYLSTQRTTEAKKVLTPIYEATPSDPVTLLNLALIHLVEGDLGSARSMADAGLRLAPTGMSWVAYSIKGMIESARGKLDEAEKAFGTAASRCTNNPLIYGMWIQSLFRADPSGKGRIPKLIREALWSDPDRVVDSPIRAPLGGHIVLAEALDGFKKGSDWPDSKLRPGQVAFVRWLEARSRFNPLSQSLPTVMEQLATEDDPISKLLYAYGLKEQGRYQEASEIMQKVVSTVEREKRPMSSSYPWTLAGDLEAAVGHVDKAEGYYQTALNRNPQDTAAVLGTALVMREKGDYTGAEQKFAEALSLDPLFAPALLRIDRFEWQRRYRAK